MLRTVLLIVLVLALLGSLPHVALQYGKGILPERGTRFISADSGDL